MATIPVAVITKRGGRPFVLFGTHYDAAGQYRVYEIGDGPDIAKWSAFFKQMERDGVAITIEESA